MSRSRMTKRDRTTITRALDNIKSAHNFIGLPDVAVCRKNRPATTTLHYTREDGSTMYEIDKEMGSDLAGLHIGIVMLEAILMESQNPCPYDFNGDRCVYREGHAGHHRPEKERA